MEGKTPTEKIHSLSNTVISHEERLRFVLETVAQLKSEQDRTNQALAEAKHTIIRQAEQIAELQRWKAEATPVKTDVAILRRDVDKLEKVKEEWAAASGPLPVPFSGRWPVGCWAFSRASDRRS